MGERRGFVEYVVMVLGVATSPLRCHAGEHVVLSMTEAGTLEAMKETPHAAFMDALKKMNRVNLTGGRLSREAQQHINALFDLHEIVLQRVHKERYSSASFGEILSPMRMNITPCKAVRKKSKKYKGNALANLCVRICMLGCTAFARSEIVEV